MGYLIPFKAPACERVNKMNIRTRTCKICGKNPAQIGNMCASCKEYIDMQRKKERKAKNESRRR